MQCTWLTGSDTRLDCGELPEDPINPLPVWCSACGFPDLNHVPQPYRIVKSRAMTSNEAVPAAYGNLLVRERVRRVLEMVVPDACTFYPTVLGSKAEVSPWMLAVPRQQIPTGAVKASIPRCRECGEPRSAHPGSQWDTWNLRIEAPHDMFKSATWASSESGWDRWIDRELFMSARLFGLLERLDVKGLDEAFGTAADRKAQQKEHKGWIDEQVAILERAGVAILPQGRLSREVASRFKQYIKRAAAAGQPAFDRKAAEKRLKLKLPPSVVEYFGSVGPRAFQNVDQQEGFTAHILPLDEWDRGTSPRSDEHAPAIDGVVFATTDHGDCFCLDVAAGGQELPVYQYMHEGDFFEPYTGSFAECILRFAATESCSIP